ncbi:MAG: type IV toxin-antitoxin system AbiEi family antitoxin domain-containing protein [Bacillota bacterium]|nr:type IV toxin-antitoxin system AbiEi family antitoxin domain-containing protein [Bacillota bacterium]
MSKLDAAIAVLKSNGGTAKTNDFIKNGISALDVANFCKAGYLERIRHGHYCLPGVEISEEKLLAVTIPEAIVSLESALFHYGYSDFTPRKWSIAVPRSFSRSKLKGNPLPLKVNYVKDDLFDLGKDIGDFNGFLLPVYDRERTICDLFKYRGKIDDETFAKALHCYTKDEHKNLTKLTEYAKQMGVYKKMFDVIGVLLNG